MFYSEETGICEHVSYERYCEMMSEKDEIIQQLEVDKEDLKQELSEAKDLINELKNFYERTLKNEINNVVNQQKKI